MDISSLLLASLQPDTRLQAEKSLKSLSAQPQFMTYLLRLVLDTTQPIQARQAGGVYFKNEVKRSWNESESDEPPIDPAEKNTLRAQLVPAMISLIGPSDRLLRVQIGEAVGVVASIDFPERWNDLIDQLVSHLSPANYAVNICVLETAHSIFSPWRSQVRSDSLFRIILFVLERFQEQFFAIFRATANQIFTSPNDPNLPQLARAMTLLVSIYNDLVDQDIPPAFEDSIPEFFGVEGGDPGYFIKFLTWNPPQLKGDDDDTTPTEPTNIKTTIFEIAELFTLKYNELFGPRMPAFVQAVWELVGSSSSELVKEDAMISQAVRFLGVAVKSGLHTALFSMQSTLEGLVERIVVPSMGLREHEVEIFEDDPLEYIRRDLSLSTEGGQTRRHAASELIRALLGIGLDAQVTRIVENYISVNLAAYHQNPAENWKSKDTAIYLLTAVAARSSTSSMGVTSTNMLVDIIKFFSDHIYQDLRADLNAIHPILQVDSIRFLHTFRYQLTKEQLSQVLPLLVRHLASSNYVCYTYAAITIERVLFIKVNNQMMFNQTDVQAYASDVLMALFARMESGGTPEKVAENEYLMKCVMRVIITAKESLTNNYQPILARLVHILGIISKNPSNPNFNQYTFESVSALVRFTTMVNPGAVEEFEKILFGPIEIIIQQEIEQFVPYVFQLLSQMLETRTGGVPDHYKALLPYLLTFPPWLPKGNIPALARLVDAYLAKDSISMAESGQLKSILGIVQQRLIPSNLNHAYGFDMLQTAVRTLPAQAMKEYWTGIWMFLFTRLQNNKGGTFVYQLGTFVLMSAAVANGPGPDGVIGDIDGIQQGLWGQVFNGVILTSSSSVQRRDQKVWVAGLIRLLTESRLILSPNNAQLWPKAFTAVSQIFVTYNSAAKTTDASQLEGTDDALTSIDYEEQSAGYQASFSKLAASQVTRSDPLPEIPGDLWAYAKEKLVAALRSDSSGQLRGLLAGVDQTSPLLQAVMSG
ncbi:importin-alpha export receptor [Tulasnella sp. 419]|nr:importin-alpha export receptor [Tulasnella sp. 419]